MWTTSLKTVIEQTLVTVCYDGFIPNSRTDFLLESCRVKFTPKILIPSLFPFSVYIYIYMGIAERGRTYFSFSTATPMRVSFSEVIKVFNQLRNKDLFYFMSVFIQSYDNLLLSISYRHRGSKLTLFVL